MSLRINKTCFDKFLKLDLSDETQWISFSLFLFSLLWILLLICFYIFQNISFMKKIREKIKRFGGTKTYLALVWDPGPDLAWDWPGFKVFFTLSSWDSNNLKRIKHKRFLTKFKSPGGRGGACGHEPRNILFEPR